MTIHRVNGSYYAQFFQHRTPEEETKVQLSLNFVRANFFMSECKLRFAAWSFALHNFLNAIDLRY